MRGKTEGETEQKFIEEIGKSKKKENA